MISSLRQLKNGLKVEFRREMDVVSSAIHNGGLGKRKGFFVMYVDKNYSGNAYEDLNEFANRNKLENYVGFMTAAWNVYFHKSRYVEAYATVGLDNLCIPGEPCSGDIGTVNIFLVLNVNLSSAGLVNALSTAMETKAYVLTYMLNAPSTTSDACGIAAFLGYDDFAGSATEIGREIGLAVRNVLERGVKGYLIKNYK